MRAFRNVLGWLLAAGALAAPVVGQSMAGGSLGALGSFGAGVAIADGDVIIGEPNNNLRPGTLYFYRKSGGSWKQASTLAAADGRAGDGFGASITIDGQTMLVTAPRSNENKGTIYVFQKSGQTWRESGRLTASDVVAGDVFGGVATVKGDLALVSAVGQKTGSGAVYVFRRTGGSWQQAGKLTSAEPKDRSAFGASLGILGDVVFVGEPGFNERTGTVHTFRADASGTYTAGSRVSPTGAAKGDGFGQTIALHGDRLLVSALGANGQVGMVFGFARDAAGEWRDSRKLSPFESTRFDGFGQSIAVDGNNVWVGAPRGFLARGSVYHYSSAPGDTLLTGVDRILQEPTGKSPSIQFGSAIAAHGDVAAVAMIGDDFGAGSVVILERIGNSWKQSTIVKSPDERIASVMGKKVECGSDGKAGLFDCKDFDLMSFMSVPDLGGSRGVRLSGNWGWTDPETKKEYALVGRMDALSIVDVTNPEKPVFVAEMAKTKEANPSSWREIKTYKNWALVVSDGSGPHGIQFLDLTRLRNIKTFPAKLEPDYTYKRVNSVHDIVVNEESGMAYAVGSSSGGETCGGGLHMIDIKDPKNPQFLGCFADAQTGRANTGYTHDAQCVMYKGPDEQYKGREICMSSNETMLSIQDVTDKKAPKVVSRAGYPKVGYTHQGWFDDDHRYFYLNDELDEVGGLTQNTRTIVWDVSDLDDPQVVKEFLGTTQASDHNLYVIGDLMYQSNYLAGLRIIDIKDRKNPVEVGYFDTVPYGTNTAGFGGSWNNYPFFKSGNIVINSGGEGLFIVKKKAPKIVS